MTTFTRLTEEERGKILAFRDTGMSIRKIAEKLKRNKNTIDSFLKDPENHGKRSAPGRPPLVDARDIRRIKSLAIKDNISPSQIRRELSLPVSTRRVQQILRSCEDVSYEKRSAKPDLLPRHKAARVCFAETYKFWQEEWRNVIFSDEKKFNLDGPDGYQYYYRDKRAPKQVRKARNFQGGSLMVWGAFGYNGKAPMCFVTHRMNAEKYVELLDDVLIAFAEDFWDNSWIFQQDNAPIHVARYTKDFFADKKIDLLQWPAKSPDLNPMENLWAILSQRVYSHGRQYSTLKELKEAIVLEWSKIDDSVLQNLINSMPRRVLQVISKKGDTI